MKYFKCFKRKYGKSSLVILLLTAFLLSNILPGGLVLTTYAENQHSTGDKVEEEKLPEENTETENADSKDDGKFDEEPNVDPEDRKVSGENKDDDTSKEQPEVYTVTIEVPDHGGELRAEVDGEKIASGEKVQEGSNIEFILSLEHGYAVEKWIVNGAVKGGGEEIYTHKNIDRDIAIGVSLVNPEGEEPSVNFKLSKLEVEPEAVKQGKQITVSASITNSGISGGKQDIVLAVFNKENNDRYTETIEGFFLPAGSTKNVKFEDFAVPGDAGPGEYTVKVATDNEEKTANLVIESAARDRDQVGDGVSDFIERNIANEESEYEAAFVEESALENVSIKVYSDSERTDIIGNELTSDSDGEAKKDLEDGDYWFTASLDGYDDYKNDFTIDGADKTVEFILNKEAADLVTLSGDETVESDGAAAEGTYKATLDANVEAPVTFTLDGFDEADIDSLSQGDKSDLLDNGVDITTNQDGEADLSITFAAGVDKSGTLKAAINEDDNNVGNNDDDELNITVDTTEFEASTYKFQYSDLEEVVVSQEVNTSITFKTDEEGDFGYDGVRFKIQADGPGDVTFKATDTEGVEHEFENEGYWGPSGGFDLPAVYDETTPWTLSFSEAGNYNITFSLIKADTEEVVADITDDYEVLVLNTDLSYFEVTITEIEPDRLSRGGTNNVTAEIKNNGSEDHEQDIKLTIFHVDGHGDIYEETKANFSVGAGETEVVMFENIEIPADAAPGEYTIKIESDDDSDISTFSVYRENEIYENITTTFKLGERVNGELKPLPEPMPHPDDEILDLGIKHTFELAENHGYGEGSFYEFQLPGIFDYEALDGIDGTLNEFGQWYIDGQTGIVRLEFNANIEGKGVEGGLEFGLGFDEENLGDSLEQVIEFKIIEETYSYTISFKPKEGTTPIDKTGTAKPQTYEAEIISWTVDINLDLKTIENAVLKDIIHEDLELVEGSIKLYDLTVDLHGNVEKGSESATSFTHSINDGVFEVEFNDTIDSAYRLKYDTTITDDEGTEYGNEATLLEGSEEIDSASVTVPVGRGEPLEKEATDYDDETQTITWEIRVNYNKKDLTPAESVVKDSFGDNQEFVENSLEIFKVELDADGEESGSNPINANDYQLDLKNDGQEGFEITFTGGIDQAHKIIYQTTATDRVEEDGTITNTASFGDETTEANQSIGQAILAKSHSNINYDEKTVKWTIEINRDSKTMSNVSLVDVFTNEGLTFKEGTFSIDSDEIGESDYDLTENDHGFEVDFHTDITEPLTITYTTGFDYEQRKDANNNNFENEVTVNWIDEDDNDKEKTASDSFTPDDFTQDDGFKEGEYDATTKEITWTVGINYNRQSIENAMFYDYVSAPGDYDLDHPSEIKVYKATINPGGGMVKAGNITSEFTIADNLEDVNGNPGFSINFGDIGSDDNYIIEYKTDLNGKLIANQYHNNAVLQQDGTDLVELDHTVTIPGGGEYAGKTGEQNGRYIDWELDINRGQSTLSNVTITDTFDDGLLFLPGSLELSLAEVNADGSIASETLQPDSIYELEINGEDNGEEYSFKLSFNESIDSRYVLRYRTYIDAAPNQDLENKAILTAKEAIPADGSEDSLAIPVVYRDGVGWAAALKDYDPDQDDPPIGNLIIEKISDYYDNTPLPGAKFGLYDSEGVSLLKSGITDEDGTLKFEDLIYGTYKIKELEAPEGYEVKEVPMDVEIDQDDPEEGKSITIENELILGKIDLTKVDGDDNEPLEGANFKLEDNEGNIYQEKVTDESGKITFDDLPPGNYKVIETAPPDGYQMPADNEIDVKIEPGDSDTGGDLKEIEVKNYLEGSRRLLIEKTDRHDSSKKLSGAKFEITDPAGSGVATVETDEDGQAEVVGLSLGEYTLTEISAPRGYRLNREPLDLEITPENTPDLVKIVEIENTRIPAGGIGGGVLPGITQPAIGEQVDPGIKTPKPEPEEEGPAHPLALPPTGGYLFYYYMIAGGFCMLLAAAVKKKSTGYSIRHKLE